MKFAAISTATGHLQGRIIGFVRDRTAAREPPTPILLPQRKTWELVKETVNTDGPSLLKYCADNPTRIGTLWKGEGGDENAQEELQAPRLIAIPLWLLDRIRQEGRALMPTSRPTIQRRMQMHGLQLYLGKWLEQRLGTTMGPCPQGSEPAAVAQRGGPAGPMTQATFTEDIGKGVALGLKALGGGYITREPSTRANEGGQ